MGYQIFEMADGQRVALYAQGNSILSCILPFARGMIPGEVRTDYLAWLDAAVFRDTVCFVYENLEHKVVLDTLGAGPARILLTDGTPGYGFYGLRLFVRDGELYLFYQVRRREKGGDSLYICMPYQENRWETILEEQTGPWELNCVETDQGAILMCTEKRTGVLRIFDWKRELRFEERRLVEEKEHGRQVNSLQAAWKEEKEALLAQREEIQAEALARLGAFQQEKEERLIQCRKEYEGRVERLRKEYEGKLAKYRDGYEQQLAQAKQQYNELAETAVKLQQIGRKWRDKYFGKDEET